MTAVTVCNKGESGAVSITFTLSDTWLLTHNSLLSGFAAKLIGSKPTSICCTTTRVSASSTSTVPFGVFVT